uniref:Uncharacterized protein n=1 Tax=Labrus bergylta TaxID=56723 RepID=A0A3Q3LAS9_9LABR
MYTTANYILLLFYSCRINIIDIFCLLGKRQNVTAAEMEELQKQAACLNLGQPSHRPVNPVSMIILKRANLL